MTGSLGHAVGSGIWLIAGALMVLGGGGRGRAELADRCDHACVVSEPVAVDPSNAAQLEAWDGEEGTYWADHADRFDHALAPHHREFMASSAILSGERVLDVGCGTGQTTRDAAREAAPATALGIDLSAAMLEVARRRAADEGVANATFLQADAQVHSFETASFDVVIARTVAMYFGDQAAAFANLRRSLRDGGRLVMLTWQPLIGNEWIEIVATALSPSGAAQLPPPGAGPFSLSEPDQIRMLLEGAGFVDIDLRAIHEPMCSVPIQTTPHSSSSGCRAGGSATRAQMSENAPSLPCALPV
jgi:SAM-dependent methyltransferase